MKKLCSWEKGRPKEISKENWDTLASLYRHPRDIDLYVGGISESPSFDGIVGKTFSCLNAKQFRRMKDGDRFFFSHAEGANPRPFSLEQVQFSTQSLGKLKKDWLIDLAPIISDRCHPPPLPGRPPVRQHRPEASSGAGLQGDKDDGIGKKRPQQLMFHLSLSPRIRWAPRRSAAGRATRWTWTCSFPA